MIQPYFLHTKHFLRIPAPSAVHRIGGPRFWALQARRESSDKAGRITPEATVCPRAQRGLDPL